MRERWMDGSFTAIKNMKSKMSSDVYSRKVLKMQCRFGEIIMTTNCDDGELAHLSSTHSTPLPFVAI